MFFGSYLLKEKLITEDQLLRAVSAQHESIPSLIKVIQDNNLAVAKDIVSVIVSSYEKRKDIVNTIREEKEFDVSVLEKAQSIQNEKTKTLGECLVELGFLDLNTLNKHLTDYLSIKSEFTEDNNVNEVEVSSPPEIEENIQIVSGDITQDKNNDKPEAVQSPDSKKDVQLDDISEKNEQDIKRYTNTFNDQLLKRLNKLCDFIVESCQSGGDIANLFSSLYRDVSVLKSSSTLVGSKSSEKLLEHWEFILEDMFNMNNEQLKEWFESYIGLLRGSINYLWEIRETISENKSEKALWLNEQWKERFLDHYNKIGALRKS